MCHAILRILEHVEVLQGTNLPHNQSNAQTIQDQVRFSEHSAVNSRSMNKGNTNQLFQKKYSYKHTYGLEIGRT
jgi:hypothetical protein